MGMAEKIAKARFMFHANVVEVGNIMSQFGILSGDKADELNKKHFYKALDCLPYMSAKDRKNLGKGIGK